MNNGIKLDYIHRNTLHTPMIHHFSDGTGRDQYIKYFFFKFQNFKILTINFISLQFFID